MLVNCNSCQKKFSVPESAITESGRLLQCGSCGNKWTQYPNKKKIIKNIEKTTSVKIKQPNNVNKIKDSVKKKKRKIGLYSEEYLKKKYGLTIKDSLNRQDKKQNKNSFGFYSYLLTISIFIITLFGVINLSKDIIIKNYPVTGPYIDYLYEFIDIVRIAIFELINLILN